jgi:hypothetical protein
VVTALELGKIGFDVVSPNWFEDKIIGVDYVRVFFYLK